MTTSVRARYIDGQRIDTISVYADDPIRRYRIRLDDGREVIRTDEQIADENPDPAQMTTEEWEWSDYGRGRCGLVHLMLGAVAFACVVGVGALYAFRVGVWG
jgi:hypothetical protein